MCSFPDDQGWVCSSLCVLDENATGVKEKVFLRGAVQRKAEEKMFMSKRGAISMARIRRDPGRPEIDRTGKMAAQQSNVCGRREDKHDTVQRSALTTNLFLVPFSRSFRCTMQTSETRNSSYTTNTSENTMVSNTPRE